jgi:hypothetical protein
MVSTIVGWDIAEYQKKLGKLEKSSNAPSNDHFDRINDYADASRDFQEKLRSRSSMFWMSSIHELSNQLQRTSQNQWLQSSSMTLT